MVGIPKSDVMTRPKEDRSEGNPRAHLSHGAESQCEYPQLPGTDGGLHGLRQGHESTWTLGVVEAGLGTKSTKLKLYRSGHAQPPNGSLLVDLADCGSSFDPTALPSAQLIPPRLPAGHPMTGVVLAVSTRNVFAKVPGGQDT